MRIRRFSRINVIVSPNYRLYTSYLELLSIHIVYVLSIKNPDFENYLGQMYPAELEIKDTTESYASGARFIKGPTSGL